MQNRVLHFIKARQVQSLGWVHFTLISVKLLRRHAEALGFKGNFTILDTDDQKIN